MRSKVEGELQEMMKKIVKAASNVTAMREVDSDRDRQGSGKKGSSLHAELLVLGGEKSS